MLCSLIRSYGLTSKLSILNPRSATKSELSSFHSSQYLEYLSEVDSGQEKAEKDKEFGLGYDCPPMKGGILNYAQTLAGSSVSAAEALIKNYLPNGGGTRLAINWYGGWHHAQRDSASGFCYVNDVVLAIHTLRQKFNKILYIDLDVHHGRKIINYSQFVK